MLSISFFIFYFSITFCIAAYVSDAESGIFLITTPEILPLTENTFIEIRLKPPNTDSTIITSTTGIVISINGVGSTVTEREQATEPYFIINTDTPKIELYFPSHVSPLTITKIISSTEYAISSTVEYAETSCLVNPPLHNYLTGNSRIVLEIEFADSNIYTVSFEENAPIDILKIGDTNKRQYTFFTTNLTYIKRNYYVYKNNGVYYTTQYTFLSERYYTFAYNYDSTVLSKVIFYFTPFRREDWENAKIIYDNVEYPVLNYDSSETSDIFIAVDILPSNSLKLYVKKADGTFPFTHSGSTSSTPFSFRSTFSSTVIDSNTLDLLFTNSIIRYGGDFYLSQDDLKIQLDCKYSNSDMSF